MSHFFDRDERPHTMKFDLCLVGLGLSLLAAGCLSDAPGPGDPTAGHPGAAIVHDGAGRAQSPIDLPPEGTYASDTHRVALHYHDTFEHIIHREHTVEVKVDPGSSLDFDGRSYVLEQFHFHTPSEHLVAGKRFPAELHLVHHSAEGEVLVVGVLIEMGEASPFLERILRDTPEDLRRVDRGKTLNVTEILPDASHFYSYRGSFTTPPFTEGVEWLVLETHPEASAEQLVRLLVLEGGNARDVQDQNSRVIEDF